MNFFLAPLLSLFSVKFYRSLTGVSMLRGVLYLLYFSIITAIIGAIFVAFAVLPGVDKEANWIAKQIPNLTFTAEGMKADAALLQPYNIKTQNGKIAVIIDTQKEAVTDKDMGEAYVFITAKKAFVRSDVHELSVYDLAGEMKNEVKGDRSFIINSGIAAEFYQAIRQWAPLFLLVLFFLIAFIWKAIAAFLYSIVALLPNLLRKEQRLNYQALFNISAAAMTPIWILQILSWFIAPLAISFNFFAALLLTALYQAVFIFATREAKTVTPHE
ncbi:MAG: DUF1189 family protein [Candidatus Omnitrophica bacterium]|nr:DUF1189 family protein [Candidatus Omnitrophota bacterium]